MAILAKNWTGRLRYAPLLNIAILLASVVTFGLAVSYANASIRTPMENQAQVFMRPRPTNRYDNMTHISRPPRATLLP